jgi:aryl-phospho-beta-D-glucosidase BglC (GH1 family)
MKKIHINKEKIVDEDGNQIIFRGVNINSPCILKYEENHDVLNDIREIKKLGANAIRVPICPAYFQSRKEYLEELIDPIVSLTKELDMYCLLDWHGQGNPAEGETRMPENIIEGFMKYDARKEVALNFASMVSKRYAKEVHVCFEIISSFYLGMTSLGWKGFCEDVVNVIRKNTDAIVVLSALDWPQNLNTLPALAVLENNVAYGIMVYPGSKEENILHIKGMSKIFPILITECGFEENTEIESYFINENNYTGSLKSLIIENNISFFAWCYHPTRKPTMLNSWNEEDLTTWGKFVKSKLLGDS